MRIFIHEEQKRGPEAVEAVESTTVAVLVQEHSEVDGDAVVMVEDGEVILAENLTLAEAGIADRGHVHVGRHKSVAVTVTYDSRDLEHDFGPAKTVARAHAWAVGDDGFGLPKDQRAKHVLALAGTNDRPAADVHLGSLADAEGRVHFDLIPKKRFEG
jgi:hypothetical protein